MSFDLYEPETILLSKDTKGAIERIYTEKVAKAIQERSEFL